MTVKLARGEADVLVVPEERSARAGDVFVYVVTTGTPGSADPDRPAPRRHAGDAGLEPGELVTEGTQKLRRRGQCRVTRGGTSSDARRAAAEGDGAAMKLSDVSVKRPSSRRSSACCWQILGLLAASRLPVRELPDVESPVVSIETDYLARPPTSSRPRSRRSSRRVAGLEGIHEDHVAEHRRPLEHRPEFALDRRSTRRRTTCVTGSRASPAACQTRPTRRRSARSISAPIRSSTMPVERHDERARADRLRGTRTRRPAGRAARGGARARGWRAALRDARLDRPRGARGAPAHGGRRRGRAAARERAVARGPPRVGAAGVHAARRPASTPSRISASS